MRFKLQLLTLLFTMAGLANAGVVTWYLHDVHVEYICGPDCALYQGYVWGDFRFDADTLTMTQFHISVGGTPTPQNYFPGVTDAQPITGSATDLTHIDMSYFLTPASYFPRGALTLALMAPLSDSATHIDIVPGATYYSDSEELQTDGEYCLCRAVTSGFISTTGPGSAPEPASFVFVLTGLGLCVFRKRARAIRRSA
jgi:hypothetical protein